MSVAERIVSEDEAEIRPEGLAHLSQHWVRRPAAGTLEVAILDQRHARSFRALNMVLVADGKGASWLSEQLGPTPASRAPAAAPEPH